MCREVSPSPGCDGRHGGSGQGGHRVGCWGAASRLSSARKPPVWGFGWPAGEPPWSPKLGAWLLPPAMVGACELQQIIRPPPPPPPDPSWQVALVQGHLCLHSTVPGRQHRRTESRGEDAPGWPLAAPRHPAGTQPGRWGPHKKSPPTVLPKPPTAARPKVLFPVGWVPPRWGRRGSVCRGGMRGRDAWPWRRLPARAGSPNSALPRCSSAAPFISSNFNLVS